MYFVIGTARLAGPAARADVRPQRAHSTHGQATRVETLPFHDIRVVTNRPGSMQRTGRSENGLRNGLRNGLKGWRHGWVSGIGGV